MKTYFISMLLFFSLSGCSQNKQNKMSEFSEVEREIIAVTDYVTELMIARDIKGLDELLHNSFTLTHITGYVQPKKEWLREIETESMKYFSFQAVKRTVEINGINAKVIQQNILDARIWGTRNNWRLQQIFKLKKQNGKWIIMSSVATTF